MSALLFNVKKIDLVYHRLHIYSLHFLRFVSASTTWSTRVVSLYRLLWFSRIFSGSPPLSALYRSRSRTILKNEREKCLGQLKVTGKNFSWCNLKRAIRMPREQLAEWYLGRVVTQLSHNINSWSSVIGHILHGSSHRVSHHIVTPRLSLL